MCIYVMVHKIWLFLYLKYAGNLCFDNDEKSLFAWTLLLVEYDVSKELPTAHLCNLEQTFGTADKNVDFRICASPTLFLPLE